MEVLGCNNTVNIQSSVYLVLRARAERAGQGA